MSSSFLYTTKFFQGNMVKFANPWMRYSSLTTIKPTSIIKSSMISKSFKFQTNTSIRNYFISNKPNFNKSVNNINKFQSKSYSSWNHRKLNYQIRFKQGWSSMKGPTLFAIAFMAVTTIATPYLFNHTPLSYFKRHPKDLVYGIIGINLVVFGLWRLPQCSRFLMRYALLEKNAMYSYWSMLGSAFSHKDFWHLGMNMLALYSFGTSLAQIVGVSNFTMLYLNGAIFSSLVSLLVPVFMKVPYNIASLGASGALFSVFGTFAYLIPSAQILFFVIPIPGGAWVAFLGSMAWNAAGVVMRWGAFDYAAHLGGSLVGIFYGWLLYRDRQKKVQRRRTSLF